MAGGKVCIVQDAADMMYMTNVGDNHVAVKLDDQVVIERCRGGPTGAFWRVVGFRGEP